MLTQMDMPRCPLCGCDTAFIGSVGIVQADGEWDAQADRIDCPEGHTFLIVATDRLYAEELAT